MKGFDDFYENLNRCFIKCESDLYCIETYKKCAVKWNGKDWEETEYDKLPENAKEVTSKTASEIAEFPPWETFKSVYKKKEEKAKQYWENLINTTKHKVLGYVNTARGSDLFMSMENGKLSDEEYAAIIKDFRKNGYIYSGEDFQDSFKDCTPVLDNYRWIDFSRRGFGGLIAMAQGDYSDMGYCHYTENMFINPNVLKYPKGGLNKGITRASSEIAIDGDVYSTVKAELKQPQGILIAIPVPKSTNGFFWIDDGIVLRFEQKQIKAKVGGIANFKEKEEFKKFLEYRRIVCVYNEQDLEHSPLLLVKL